MTAMPQALVGSGRDILRLTADDPTGAPPQSLVAELQLNGLSAVAPVVSNYATGFTDLADFFQRQADDWRGWEGVRDWQSLEGDLSIQASHQYGHVQLRITLRRVRFDWGNDGWTATGDLTIDPGEQLSQVARDVRSLATGLGD